MKRIYLAIDLKSFYASVECVERGLNPLDTNLVVADPSRTEKTICLAVTPSLKAYGIPGRARLFEVVQRVKEVNALRRSGAPGGAFSGKSVLASELDKDPALELDYIVAPPRMARYMAVSAKVYEIYLRHVSPEDIHVYSIDEVFIDATTYLRTGRVTAKEFAGQLIREVLAETGVTATAGIGTNLYLSKIAMDIEAKHLPADADGVRIAELDEMSYRKKLWDHRPLTDFWRVGRGYAARLEANGMFTMGDVARVSLYQEGLLYHLFGVNAELLIDHAWGWEPCTMEAIHSYRPQSSSLSTGQVLQKPYDFDKGLLIIREMTDLLTLELVEKRLVTDQITLHIGYDTSNLRDPARRERYAGPVRLDGYGRTVPKSAHGAVSLPAPTSSTKILLEAVTGLYRKIVDTELLVRRMSVTANRLIAEWDVPEEPEQLDLFTDEQEREQQRKREAAALAREKSMQYVVLDIRKKYGKNAILRGMNFQEGATTRSRNGQVGGHRA